MPPSRTLIPRCGDHQGREFWVSAAELQQTLQCLYIEAAGFDFDSPATPAALKDRVNFKRLFPPVRDSLTIKLSSLVSDLLGLSARRMLQALADGETDADALAALADRRLQATPAQLRDALGACSELHPVYRRLVKMALEQLQGIEQQIGKLDQEMQSSGWPRSPGSGWIRRSKSLLKWVLRQPPSPLPKSSPLGLGHARERKRARA